MKSGFKKIIILVFTIVFGFCSFQRECFANEDKNTEAKENLPKFEDYFEVEKIRIKNVKQDSKIAYLRVLKDGEIFIAFEDDKYKIPFLYDIKTNKVRPFEADCDNQYMALDSNTIMVNINKGFLKKKSSFQVYDIKTKTLKKFKNEKIINNAALNLLKLNDHMLLRNTNRTPYRDKKLNAYSFQIYDTEKMECYFPKVVSRKYLRGKIETPHNPEGALGSNQGYSDYMHDLSENEHLMVRSGAGLMRTEVYNSKTNEYKPLYTGMNSYEWQGIYQVNGYKKDRFFLQSDKAHGGTWFFVYEYKDEKIRFLDEINVNTKFGKPTNFFLPMGGDEIMIYEALGDFDKGKMEIVPYVLSFKTGVYKRCEKYIANFNPKTVSKLKDGVWITNGEDDDGAPVIDIITRKENSKTK